MRPILRALLPAVLLAWRAPAIVAQSLPARLSDGEFWQMMETMSEPDGVFQSENMLSNETGYQLVIPELQRIVKPGGVYIGVGPEQNFTYLAALHPAMAFIVDIRHQNAMQHLLYKALFDLSATRSEFLAALFSRPRPAALGDAVAVDSLFAAFRRIAPDTEVHDRVLAAVMTDLMQRHGFALTSAEQDLIVHNFDAIFAAGPDLNYGAGSSGFRRNAMPTYNELMVLTDSAGVQHSFLASETNYRAVRDLEERNLVVPLTGDFSGPRALRAVGDYVRAHHATITTFYASNVEQYLFREGNAWTLFEQNIVTMPLDSTSQFIRSTGMGGGFGMRRSLLQSMQSLLALVARHGIASYADLLAASH